MKLISVAALLGLLSTPCLMLVLSRASEGDAPPPTIESVRIETMRVAEEMSLPKDTDYSSVDDNLKSLQQHIGRLVPKGRQVAILAKLQKDVDMLGDAYALWGYAREHNPFPGHDSLNSTKISDSDPLYSMLQSKYQNTHNEILKMSLHETGSQYVSGLMRNLTSEANADALYLKRDLVVAQMQGNGSLQLRYPLTHTDVLSAISVGSRTNEDALLSFPSEWNIHADRKNEADVPNAIIKTPFLKAALISTNRKAKYESAPNPLILLALPQMQILTADIAIDSASLNAFDDSTCVIKQGGSFVRAIKKSVDQPTVTSSANYAYDILCDFPMAKFKPHTPFAVTLANITLFNMDDLEVKKGEIHFNVDPSKMR